MKGRVIVIDMPRERASQAALIVDGRVEDFLIDQPNGDLSPAPGQIYHGRVARTAPAIGGAFVSLDDQHNGFLREAKGLKPGQGLIVQVTSYGEPGKALPVTRRTLFKGRTIIVTPGSPGVNVSRQIRETGERERLTSIVERYLSEKLELSIDDQDEWHEVCESSGVILRSAASGVSEDELREELGRVIASAVSVKLDFDAPRYGMISRSGWAFDTFIREWCHPLPASIVATRSAFRTLSKLHTDMDGMTLPVWGEFCSMELYNRLTEFKEEDPFDHLGVWDEIEKLKSPRADLPSGGWMAVEATRAMVTVDVNTGDQFSGGAGMTANVEAARELPRQLRLRGLGGQVIIDFAPMKKAHRKKIEEVLKAAFRKDAIETSLAGWTPLGNFELQRKRERRPLTEVLHD